MKYICSFLVSLSLVSTALANPTFQDPDLEDPKLVEKMPVLGVVYGVNIPNAFVLMKPSTAASKLRVGETVALHRAGSIVTLGKIEAIDGHDSVTIYVKLDMSRGEAYFPKGKEKVIYYPLRLSSVSQLADE